MRAAKFTPASPVTPAALCLPASVGALPPSGPRSSSSAPPANPPSTLVNPSLPFTSSPDPTPSQNPLSLMMSQMSKYAMPSSTPLYHNAIKTIATSDDELLPDRPLLPPPAPPQGSGPGASREGVPGRRAHMGSGRTNSGRGQRPPLRSRWLFCASKGPWVLGVVMSWDTVPTGHSVKPSPAHWSGLSKIY